MNKVFSVLVSFVMALGIIVFPKNNDLSMATAEEVRAAWISTVFNIDWPSKASYSNAEVQKMEYINLLEKLKAVGINTVMVQVRPESDAIYKSSINPWSRFLTGTQGKNPGYDPLDFIIRESHNRGIKVHAWFNPYRASVHNERNKSASTSLLNKRPDLAINYNGKWYYDPGKPEVVRHIVDTVSEVVRNYDVDGVHFDDYFYPGPEFPDSATFKKYGSGNIQNWRRNNVNTMVKRVHDAIKNIKPNVDFGVSPAGIWRNKSNDPNGSNTSGGESYAKQYADTRYWIKNNLIDYVVPQVYWKIGHPKADYQTLVKWWSNQVSGTNVDLYIGQGIYKHGQAEYNGENVAKEIKNQILLNRKYSNIGGSVFFSAKDVVNIPQVSNDLKSLYVSSSNQNNQNNQSKDPRWRLPYQSSMFGADRAETAVQISKKGWTSISKTVVLVRGEDTLSAVVASPLASQNDAPILLTFTNKISDSTLNEIKRLKAERVIVVGSEDAIERSEIRKIESAVPDIYIDEIYSINAQDSSAKIAQRLSEDRKIDTVYIASEQALPDVLSVAAKAGNQRNPILISSKNTLSQNNISWLKDNNVENVYFIGGPNSLSNSVISQVNTALSRDFSGNRIYGDDRIDTNTRVIEKFYDRKFTQKAFITRASAPIDAITVSAFAQRSDSPIILAGNSSNDYQNRVLEPRSASLVYKIGGGINQNSYNRIYKLLEGVMN